MSFPPHKFIQIGRQHLFMNPLHPLKLGFNPVPVRLYILCVRSCGGIYKGNGVVHCGVLRNRWEALYSPIRWPFITMDDCAWPHVLLNNWQQDCSSSLWNYFHVAKGGTNWSVHHSKHPHLSPWRSASMTLGICTCNLKEIQVHSFDTLGLWRNSDSSIWTTFPGPPNIRGASRPATNVPEVLITLYCSGLGDFGLFCCISDWILAHQDKPLLHVKLWLLKESPFAYALGLSAGSYWTPPSNNIMFVPLLLFMLLFEFTSSCLEYHFFSASPLLLHRRDN